MGIEFEQTKVIRSDPEVVWELLEKPDGWKTWWPDCVSAATVDERTLREGSELELVLQPRHLRLTFRPVVSLLTERRLLSLTHRSALTQSTIAWYLHERPDATVVKVELVYNGIFPFFVTILQQSSAVRASMNRNLRGLKRAAEKLV